MLVAHSANASTALTLPQAASPVPLLLYRRGFVSPKGLAALESDPRVEVFAPAELTAEWIAFGQRAGACLVATSGDPLDALTYAVMAGLRNRVVMAIEGRHECECDALMRAGAFACFAMPFSQADVGALVASLAPHAASPHVNGALRLVLDPIGRTIRHLDRSARLTQREFALLHCLVSHAGRAVRAEELLATAWGDNPKAAESRQVLEVYVHQLRKKLASVGLAGVIRCVRGFGYELAGCQDDAARFQAVAMNRS